MVFETTLPGRYFYDPEIFAREQSCLFGQMWTCVGRADALPGGGDFQTVELAGRVCSSCAAATGRCAPFSMSVGTGERVSAWSPVKIPAPPSSA
jgi:hypothetical protein